MIRAISEQIEYWNLQIERFYSQIPSVIDNGDEALIARDIIAKLREAEELVLQKGEVNENNR